VFEKKQGEGKKILEKRERAKIGWAEKIGKGRWEREAAREQALHDPVRGERTVG